jgi:hypothetical protein
MLNPVSIADYEARYGDVPEGVESDQITEKLDDAWEVLVAIMPSLPSRYESGKVTQRLLARVITAAVNRAVLNPKGYSSETVGPFSYTLREGDSGSIFFTDAELALLGRRGRVGNVYLKTRWPNWAGDC